jgi:hypothetical protein
MRAPDPIKCWVCSGTGKTLYDPHGDEETCLTCLGCGHLTDHPAKCRCRDCRDARGDHDYHIRQGDQA